MVRVYAHNLRQKLEHFYATTGRGETASARARARRVSHLADDRGRTSSETVDDAAGAADACGRRFRCRSRARTVARWRFAAAGAALLALGVALGVGITLQQAPAAPAADRGRASPLWAGMLDDDLPILLVVGDYYIYGELDEYGDVTRLVRDFSVGSSKELDELMMNDSSLMSRYLDLDLTYLPTGSAFALLDVLRVLYTSEQARARQSRCRR